MNYQQISLEVREMKIENRERNMVIERTFERGNK